MEHCNADESALTQVYLLRGIAKGLGELWCIRDWNFCQSGLATEVVVIDALRFTPTQIETFTRGVYFDTRSVVGNPCMLHPLISWRGPVDIPFLPYELGWLHFDKVLDNTSCVGGFDQTILYSGFGAKASIYIYLRSDVAAEAEAGAARAAELKRASEVLMCADLKDPWPVVEKGPFAIKFYIDGSDITTLGVAVRGRYFVKVRLTYFDDPKMRELMNSTLNALCAFLQLPSATKH
ncbi:hypothetical protein [Microbulbifer guangxiensis]|uniref:hypothetical protein n=1 Tax=Microbulbifer guangxiensis TaxID=2904249 RepID=UPI001F227486|nr:hypothetical protein [Microbulbifer guangxiensis]